LILSRWQNIFVGRGSVVAQRKKKKAAARGQKRSSSAVGRKQKPTSSRYWPLKFRGRVVFLIILGLVIVSLPLIGSIATRFDGMRTIEAYLENKYKRDFVVGFPVRKASGFGVEGHLKSVVYPVGEPDLTFEANTSSGGTSDEYPAAVWKQQEKKVLDIKLREIFGTLPSYTLEIYSYSLNRVVSGYDIPSLDSTALKYPDKIQYWLTIDSDVAITDESRLAEAEKYYQLYQYVKAKKVSAKLTYRSLIDERKQYYGIGFDIDSQTELGLPEELVSEFKKWEAKT
jgi:hypothetical protein